MRIPFIRGKTMVHTLAGRRALCHGHSKGVPDTFVRAKECKLHVMHSLTAWTINGYLTHGTCLFWSKKLCEFGT